mmetsp:Transcript_274/g.513  ORF Transcript_274/g.513 Transcript_274/m.513 type:complete len:86 (-) Transcript_274:58-315(-)
MGGSPFPLLLLDLVLPPFPCKTFDALLLLLDCSAHHLQTGAPPRGHVPVVITSQQPDIIQGIGGGAQAGSSQPMQLLKLAINFTP